MLTTEWIIPFFLDGDVSFGPIMWCLHFIVYFECICNNVSDFNDHNLVLTEKHLH